MTAAERNLFALAENLGMTVCELKQRMPLGEYVRWLKFHSENAELIHGPEKPQATTKDDMLRFFGVSAN